MNTRAHLENDHGYLCIIKTWSLSEHYVINFWQWNILADLRICVTLG